MLDNIKDKIKSKKLILFGEIHGTKEIPESLCRFFSEIAREEDFNLCIEIPEEFQNIELDKLLSLSKETNTNGLISKEYVKLIKEMPKNIKIFFIAPDLIKNQEEMEKSIALNILKLVNDKKIFVILGDIHASKKEIKFFGDKIIPAGLLIFNKLKEKMINVRIKIKNNNLSKEEKLFNKGFDHIIEL